MNPRPRNPPTLQGDVGHYHISYDLKCGGSFSQIYKVIDNENGIAKVAKVRMASMTSSGRELITMNALNGLKGLCPLLDSFSYADRCVLILPLLAGDLNTLRCHNKNNSLCKKTCWKVCWQVLNALEAMHTRFFMHRDIKPANIVVMFNSNKKTGTFVLGDFGEATVFGNGVRRIAEGDWEFETGETKTYRMARGQPSSEADDLGMLAYTLVRLRNIDILGRYAELEMAKRQQLEQRPQDVLRGEEQILLKMVQALFNQLAEQAPNYDRVREAIKSQAKPGFDPDGPVKIVRDKGVSYLRIR